MKALRYLFVIAIICSLAPVAKANSFAMVVVDPPVYTFYDITSLGTPYTLSWGDCAPGEVPPGSPTDGCISLFNGTGVAITSLELTVPDTGGVLGDMATCPADPNSIFASVTCTPDPVAGAFTFDFFGGDGVAPRGFFVIAESGVDPSTFPDITAVAGVPEPSSIWLLSTGILMSGVFFIDRRRRAIFSHLP